MLSGYSMSKQSKILMAGMDKSVKSIFKKMMIDAEVTGEKAERMTMMYDVAPNGKRSKPKNEK